MRDDADPQKRIGEKETRMEQKTDIMALKRRSCVTSRPNHKKIKGGKKRCFPPMKIKELMHAARNHKSSTGLGIDGFSLYTAAGLHRRIMRNDF